MRLRPEPAITIRSLAALAALSLASCRSPTSVESRRHLLATLDRNYAETRDAAPHGGVTFAGVAETYRAAYLEADDPEASRVALVKLLDRTGDRHASVRTPDHPRLVSPSGTLATRLDDRAWLELPGGSPGGTSTWVRLETIDGYRPVMAKSAIQLLLGPPGTRVEITGTTADGVAVARRLVRDPAPRGRISESRNSHEAGFERILERMVGVPEAEGKPLAYAGRLGPAGDVGYLRIRNLNRGTPCDAEACRSGAGCEDRNAIAKAVAEVEPCPTVIIDLQGNSGGSCHHAGEVLRTLLPPDLERVPFVHAGEDPADSFPRWPVEPASRRKHRRLIVLVDDRTASAAEHIPAILAGRPDVTIVGAPTCGCEYSTVTLKARDEFTLVLGGIPSTWDEGFASVEGRPIRPDVEIPLDRRMLVTEGPLAAALARRKEIVREGLVLAGLDPDEVIAEGW